MSERYGNCRLCRGAGKYQVFKEGGVSATECPQCDGTGHSGDATDYLRRESAKDWEQNEALSNPVYWERD